MKAWSDDFADLLKPFAAIGPHPCHNQLCGWTYLEQLLVPLNENSEVVAQQGGKNIFEILLWVTCSFFDLD